MHFSKIAENQKDKGKILKATGENDPQIIGRLSTSITEARKE